ncbi:hypothetical protein ASG02_12050 [Exiguobacterium sp. Leaf196]|jgi:DNA phosphorothioation-dependent restriction protein DptH|nr:DNA phosphorothioation-dependent restriction protein DptH [Exiguobacterium sp. Leaf196]KQS37702.1 hypothetical protein ASG02_12050 [Exiguobacterium sp. Leaf196]
MSNPFFNHISQQLNRFFQQEALNQQTDRYYVHLPSRKHVVEMYNALSNLSTSKPFQYRHPSGTRTYETISLEYGSQKFVIAATGIDTSIDFLVTLRNEMSEQKGIWKGTSLVLLSDTLNDSIRGGGRNLMSEGLPLHVSQMVKSMDELLEVSRFSKVEQAAFMHYLKNREQTTRMQNTSFLDFEETLALLEKGNLEQADYRALHYFQDSGLGILLEEQARYEVNSREWMKREREIDRRLDVNTRKHEEIGRLVEMGNARDRLEELYDKGASTLSDDEKWYVQDFNKILEWEEVASEKKVIHFEANGIQVSTDDITPIEEVHLEKRPKADTTAGRREWNLLLFAPSHVSTIELKLPFDRHVSNRFISTGNAVSSGHSIRVNIDASSGETLFERVVYKHENKAASTYKFNIAILRCPKEWLVPHFSSFQVDTTPKSKQAIRLNFDGRGVRIGEGETEIPVLVDDETVTIDEGAILLFKGEQIEEQDEFRFRISDGRTSMPIVVKDIAIRSIPLEGSKLWEKKRQSRSSFKMLEDGKRVEIDNLPYTIYENDRRYLMMEKNWTNTKMRSAAIRLDELEEVELELPHTLEEIYMEFLQTIERKGGMPSLIHYDEEMITVGTRYVDAYLDSIEQIESSQVMIDAERNLFRLGMIREGKSVYFSPFAPLNVAYQLQVSAELAEEQVDANILRRLKAMYVVPYLKMQDDLYMPIDESRMAEWHLYRPSEEASVGETSSYLAKIVSEKMTQFVDHYEYLFSIDEKAALRINVVNIANDREVLRGIVDWLKGQVRQSGHLDALRHIEVTSYKLDEKTSSFFDELNEASSASIFKERTGIDFATKDFEADEVMVAFQSAIHYMKKDFEETMEYAHVTFYKMRNEENISRQLMTSLPSSMNLNGLFTTSVSSRTDSSGYRSGYGIGESDTRRTQLTRFGYQMNELIANMQGGGHDAYTKGIALAMHVRTESERFLKSLYESAHWVTFIDPSVDLKYFQESSDHLVIVHYSDQLSSSSSYDAITVTDKSNLYFNVIEEIMQSQQVEMTKEAIQNVILAFNTFNGEWLLRAVQNRSHDKREKMSLVSAIKRILLHVDHPNIRWVPVAMEEIVRVTGSVGLSRKDGLFSGKTIGRRGNCSDDLMLMGLEQVGGRLKLHLYPVEVKIGLNETPIIDKGISQVKELKQRLHDYLVADEGFDARFLRNYFARIYLNNLDKIKHNEVWPERDYTVSGEEIDGLLNDDFDITNELEKEFGAGFVVSFRKAAEASTSQRRDGVVVLEYPEYEGYATLAYSMKELSEGVVIKSPPKLPVVTPPVVTPPVVTSPVVTSPVVTPPDKEIRPWIGRSLGKAVHWEFMDKNLSNRHLLIGGRSGQGKTYFIQSILLDLANSGQSALVIDYSSSYTLTQLDEVFLKRMEGKLTERIVYHEGFPLNPFRRRDKEVVGRIEKEKPNEVATRVADVFQAVYKTFGPQQKSALYEATKRGIIKHGDHMRMEHLLKEIKELDIATSSVIASITSRLTQFVDMDPFDYEAEDKWKEYFGPGGKVTVIQLAGYDQDDIKKLMTEFILWDLWYFTQDGTKDEPIPVVLDEAQNLSFTDGSPAAKILREGRKFGWSAWFATQTFNNFAKDELSILDNAGTKIYFSPAESELKILASRIGMANPDDLRQLRKGQCLSVGHFLDEQGRSYNGQHIVDIPALNEK